MTQESKKIHGVMAEFPTPDIAADAALAARREGFLHLDAYGPFSSPELIDAIGFRERKMAPCVLAGGIVGGLGGYALQYYVSVIDYPHNIGGRPLHSWPSFIPATFETTVLGATVIGVISLLMLNRLPRLSHPSSIALHFERATSDHFFLCLRAQDASFSSEKAREVLQGFSPLSISVIAEEER